MRGWRVERAMRTAYRSLPFRPDGGSPLMPPHSQGAERRPERRAGHTGSRWALRALVIGGLAGAAWLLTGAAAQAADRTEEPSGSLLGSVLSGPALADSVLPDNAAVGGLLKAAAQPLESRPEPRRHVVPSILAVPERVLSDRTPVPTVKTLAQALGEDRHDEDSDGAVIDDAIGDLGLAIPLPASNGSVDDGPQPSAPASAGSPTAPHTTVAPAAGERAKAPARTVAKGAPLAAASDGTRAVRMTAGDAPAARGKATSRIHRHAALVRAAVSETVQEHTPGGDGPAPLQTTLGAVSGTPASSGSGVPTDGGSPAVLPCGFAKSTMADQRLPLVADVEARPHDAEAPTVSPD